MRFPMRCCGCFSGGGAPGRRRIARGPGLVCSGGRGRGCGAPARYAARLSPRRWRTNPMAPVAPKAPFGIRSMAGMPMNMPQK